MYTFLNIPFSCYYRSRETWCWKIFANYEKPCKNGRQFILFCLPWLQEFQKLMACYNCKIWNHKNMLMPNIWEELFVIMFLIMFSLITGFPRSFHMFQLHNYSVLQGKYNMIWLVNMHNSCSCLEIQAVGLKLQFYASKETQE